MFVCWLMTSSSLLLPPHSIIQGFGKAYAAACPRQLSPYFCPPSLGASWDRVWLRTSGWDPVYGAGGKSHTGLSTRLYNLHALLYPSFLFSLLSSLPPPFLSLVLALSHLYALYRESLSKSWLLISLLLTQFGVKKEASSVGFQEFQAQESNNHQTRWPWEL